MTPCTEAAVAAPNHTMHPVPDHIGMVATTLRVLPDPDGLHKSAPDGTHAAQPCRQVLPVDNHPGVYCDAYVADGDRLIFASLVGRSGKIMAMYSVIVAGLDRYFRVDGRIFDIDKSLEKRQTKLPASCRYGKDCVHAMLYAPPVGNDSLQRRALLRDVDDVRLWDTLQHMSTLGLLDHWRTALLTALRAQDMLRPLPSMGIDAVLLDLADSKAYEALVQDMIRDGHLRGEAA